MALKLCRPDWRVLKLLKKHGPMGKAVLAKGLEYRAMSGELQVRLLMDGGWRVPCRRSRIAEVEAGWERMGW